MVVVLLLLLFAAVLEDEDLLLEVYVDLLRKNYVAEEELAVHEYCPVVKKVEAVVH